MTTGRRRRCGWFDAVIARYATRVNGITDYFLTKLDVLSSLPTVPVCVGYTVDGKRTDEMPMTQSEIARAEPVYEELPGWWEDISSCRAFEDLPAKARDMCCGWRSWPAHMFRASGWARDGIRPSFAATCWHLVERSRLESIVGGSPGSRCSTSLRASAGSSRACGAPRILRSPPTHPTGTRPPTG